MSVRMLCFAAVCALLSPPLSRASVVNGDFETGNLGGWTPVGFAHVSDSTFGVTPTEGTWQGTIHTTGNFTALAEAK